MGRQQRRGVAGRVGRPFGEPSRGMEGHRDAENRQRARAEANPKGIPSQSPGLRAASYPGETVPMRPQPQRGCDHRVVPQATTPLGLRPFRPPLPRVARASQPWALGHNPFGIGDAIGRGRRTRARTTFGASIQPSMCWQVRIQMAVPALGTPYRASYSSVMKPLRGVDDLGRKGAPGVPDCGL